MTNQRVVAWLLEEDQPSIRYLTLTTLLGKSASDPEVRAARKNVPLRGWAHDILARRDPAGWWASAAALYTPKYVSTNWQMIALADLGADRSLPAVDASARLWIQRMRSADGGFGVSGGKAGHHCTTGNSVRSLVRLGYGDDPAVRSGLDWLVRTASHLGGWSCYGTGRNLDSWEGLSAFAVYPKGRWTADMQRVVEQASEFFLQRELHRQGDPYPPWERFHYPTHYYYDLLVGLDLLTALGYRDDPRLRYALDRLERKRRPDGRWLLDAVHPDVEGANARWFAAHPTQAPIPFSLEPAGKPSKMITLLAQRVLARVDGTV